MSALLMFLICLRSRANYRYLSTSYILHKYHKILKEIAIIVLNWQDWQNTISCLNSLQQLSYTPITIIVCDNGSEDDSFEQILNWAQQHYFPSEIGIFSRPHFIINETNYSFVLIQTGANLGFAGGNNIGIRYALLTRRYKYLWLLNNDTIVAPKALTNLSEYSITNPNIALLGSTVIDYYQRDTIQCAGGCRYFPLFTIFKPILAGQLIDKVIQHQIKLDYIYGAAMFFQVKAIRKVGLLNEEYFLFYEELDYCQRLKQQDYLIGWCRDSLVYHKGSASIGNVSEGDAEKLSQANYYENLNTLKYTAKFHRYLLPLVLITRFVGKSFFLIKRREFYLFKPLLKAYRDFIFGSSA
ncbi:MAG: glycosyltransferase family 2 protein [Candidatus Marithrix sp.]|nr:glycosyltransferase family 2 protein [Candidatus Marithrix sp.]